MTSSGLPSKLTKTNQETKTMCNEQYNGWTNRETWLINVWYSPETVADVDYLEEMLEEEYDNMPNGALKDMCYLDSVNWNELKEAVANN